MYQASKDKVYLPPMTVTSSYHPSGFMDGVIVPVCQAIVGGMLAAGFVCSLLAVFDAQVNFWRVGLAVGSFVAFMGWLSYRGHWAWTIEKILGVDLNNDGAIGRPKEPEPENIRIELIQDEGRRGDFIDLPYPEKLPILASGVLQGRQFSQSVWTGQGGSFSRSEFENLRSELIKRGLARWKNASAPAQGLELTLAGKAIFRRLADRGNHSPTLSEGE